MADGLAFGKTLAFGFAPPTIPFTDLGPGCGMTEEKQQNAEDVSLLERVVMFLLTITGLAYVLLGDYTPLALAVILILVFAVYLASRTLIYWENDRFSPRRIQVGLTWIMVGLDPETTEFDPRPVRVYFVILGLMFAGLILRPILRIFALGGTV